MRTRGLLIAGVAAVAVAIAYANSLDNGFHFDDGHSIQDNAYLRDLRYLPDYFTDVRTFSPLAENRSYRPVLLVGYALSHALGGGAPWGYHVGSMLLHGLGAWIVGLLLLRLLRASGHPEGLSRAAGAAGAALFAVHPLLSETVDYLSARSSLQGAVLLFATVLLYTIGRETGRRRWLVAAGLALAVGMLSKLTAVTAPALLVAWELLLGPDRARLREVSAKAWLRRIGPFVAIAAALAVVHELAVGAYARGARSLISPWSHLLTQTRVWLRYQGLFVWPEDLCADLTMQWSQSPWEGPTARAILFVTVLVVVAFAQRRRWPISAFGIFWFYVTLSPTNSFVPLSEPATEHRVYIAAPGLLFVAAELALGWARTRRRQAALAIASSFAVLALTARTIDRNRVWADDVSLWGSVLECAPDNGRAHLNYGRGLLAAGDVEGARRAYAKCAALWPGYAFCPINQAALALREGELEAADRFAARALTLQPKNVYALYWRGRVDLALERYEAAARSLEAALEVSPGFGDAERALGVARFELGALDEAERRLRPFAARGRLDAEGWFAWGFLRDRAQDADGALAAYEHALRLEPAHTRARYNRGVLHQRAGRLEAAIADYRALAVQASVSPDLLFNLALAELAAGQLEAARRTRDRLAREHPGYSGIQTLDRALPPG